MHIHVHAYTHTHMHTHMYTYIHTRTHMYTHIISAAKCLLMYVLTAYLGHKCRPTLCNQDEASIRTRLSGHVYPDKSILTSQHAYANFWITGTYVHTYTYTHIHTYTYTYTHMHTHMYTHIHTRTHMHTHMYTHIHTRTHMHTHIHTRTHMHTHIHTRTHMYTHIHTVHNGSVRTFTFIAIQPQMLLMYVYTYCLFRIQELTISSGRIRGQVNTPTLTFG